MLAHAVSKRGRSSLGVSLERHRDSDSVLSLAGSCPIASEGTNQATDAQTDIIPVSHPANRFSRSGLAHLNIGMAHSLTWILHLSNVCLILSQFNQHLLRPWMISSSRLGRPVGQLNQHLICPPAGSGVYYQWWWGAESVSVFLIDNKKPALPWITLLMTRKYSTWKLSMGIYFFNNNLSRIKWKHSGYLLRLYLPWYMQI